MPYSARFSRDFGKRCAIIPMEAPRLSASIGAGSEKKQRSASTYVNRSIIGYLSNKYFGHTGLNVKKYSTRVRFVLACESATSPFSTASSPTERTSEKFKRASVSREASSRHNTKSVNGFAHRSSVRYKVIPRVK